MLKKMLLLSICSMSIYGAEQEKIDSGRDTPPSSKVPVNPRRKNPHNIIENTDNTPEKKKTFKAGELYTMMTNDVTAHTTQERAQKNKPHTKKKSPAQYTQLAAESHNSLIVAPTPENSPRVANTTIATSLRELAESWDLDNQDIYIQPKDFNAFGKAILKKSIDIWIEAIQEANVPSDTGLAKILCDMHTDGVEKLVHDLAALKKTSEYNCEYIESFTYRSLQLIQKMKRGKNGGNYYFPGADEVVEDTTRILRQNEYYNILYKRHESPIMPACKLVTWYYDQTTASAKEVLILNKDNTTLSTPAIRGMTLLTAYHFQQDNPNV